MVAYILVQSIIFSIKKRFKKTLQNTAIPSEVEVQKVID